MRKLENQKYSKELKQLKKKGEIDSDYATQLKRDISRNRGDMSKN